MNEKEGVKKNKKKFNPYGEHSFVITDQPNTMTNKNMNKKKRSLTIKEKKLLSPIHGLKNSISESLIEKKKYF